MNHLRPLSLVLYLYLGVCADAASQPPPKVLIINTDASVGTYRIVGEQLDRRLPERGYVVTQIDVKKIGTDSERIRRTIRREDPDMIHCIGSNAYSLARPYVRTRKVTFSAIINYRRLPLDYVHGVSSEPSLAAQVYFFRYFFPEIRRIGIPYSKVFSGEVITVAQREAPAFGLELVTAPIKHRRHTRKTVAELLPKVDALWLLRDKMVAQDLALARDILKMAEAAGKPVFSYQDPYISEGTTLTIVADIATMINQVVDLIDDLIMKRDVVTPYQSPSGTYIVLNRKKVEQYGLKLNQKALASVNRIVQ